MFAMLGWAMNGDFHEDEIPHKAWRLADKMIDTMKKEKEDEEDAGIAAVVPKRRARKS